MNSNSVAVSTGAELADYAPAVAAAIANAHSPRTRASYARQFKAFCEWTAAAGVAELPASPAAVAAYLTTLAQQGTALASIRLAASAIAAAHIAQSLENPCASAGVKAALKGIGRSIGKPQVQAKPLTAEALGAIAQTAYIPRPRGRGLESAHIAERRGRIDIALCRTRFCSICGVVNFSDCCGSHMRIVSSALSVASHPPASPPELSHWRSGSRRSG